MCVFAQLDQIRTLRMTSESAIYDSRESGLLTGAPSTTRSTVHDNEQRSLLAWTSLAATGSSWRQ